MLKLNNISKRFNKEQALHPFTHEVGSGKTSVVIGPSGCGKSTLLRLITGLVQSDTGNVSIDSIRLSRETLPELRLRMGYVIQEGGLFPHLTNQSNVTVMASYLGWDVDRIENRLQELLSLVQLPQDLLRRYPSEISGGQRQRVSLMRALMLDPDLLLLDEPLGALDPMIRYDLQYQLKDIFNRLEKTVLLVTHDIGEAAFLGDELILLREGKLEQLGSIVDFMNNPANEFVEHFVRAQRHNISEIEGAEK